MGEQDIKNLYFDWLYQYGTRGRANNYVSYKKLFELLYNTDFKYTVKNDINRAVDGIDLRNRFSFENDYVDVTCLRGPCSILEMILALAIRCEETLMSNTNYGDRTRQWFWYMLNSLGISYMTDDRFNLKEAEDILYNFNNHNYSKNGRGGLFYIRTCEEDMRKEEIWTQMCWYLNGVD